MKRGKPGKMKLIDSPDFSGRRRSGFASSSNCATHGGNRPERKKIAPLLFLVVIGQTIPRAPSGRDREERERERRNEYYIAVRKLLTDDVVAATLLARVARRFFPAVPGHCYPLVIRRRCGDATEDKIAHGGPRPRPTTQVSGRYPAGKQRRVPTTRRKNIIRNVGSYKYPITRVIRARSTARDFSF